MSHALGFGNIIFMDKTLLSEFKKWFLEFKKEHEYNWSAERFDTIFFLTSKNFERLLKKTERSIDSKIDKEITSKKQDRPTLMKAKRLTKGKNFESKYIDLRFNEEWEIASEKILEPFIAKAMKDIALAQKKYENEQENDWRNDPRFK